MSACATCFRQCPLYTFSERLFPTDLHLLDGGVVGGKGRQGQTASLPQRLPLEGPGSSKERLGVRAACMGSCDQLWLPGVGAQVHSRRKTAGVGVRCLPHPSPTWSSSSMPAPSSPCASLRDPCFRGVLACSHCHHTYNRHLFLTARRLDIRRWLVPPEASLLGVLMVISSSPHMAFLCAFSLPMTLGSGPHPYDLI